MSLSCFSQFSYTFNFQFLYFDDNIVFVDTVADMEFTLDSEGKLTSRYCENEEIKPSQIKSDKKRYYRDQILNKSRNELIEQLEKHPLTLNDGDKYQMQQINGEWLYLEADLEDKELDFDLWSLNEGTINGVPVLIFVDDDEYEMIFIIQYNNDVIGLSRDGIHEQRVKIKLCKEDKEELSSELEVRYPNRKRNSRFYHYDFGNERTYLIDTLNGLAKGFKHRGGWIDDKFVGYETEVISNTNKKIHQIEGKVSISDMKFFDEGLFGGNNLEQQNIYYTHITKNIFAKIERIDTFWKVHEYETLINIELKDGRSIFMGNNMIISKLNGKIELINAYGPLHKIDNTDLTTSFLETKLSLYQMKVSIINDNGRFSLFDQSGKYNLLESSYDSISLNGNYISLYKEGQKEMYNSRFDKLDMSMTKHWDIFSHSPQVILKKENQNSYLDYNGEIISNPKSIYIECDVVGPQMFNDHKVTNSKNTFIRIQAPVIEIHGHRTSSFEIDSSYIDTIRIMYTADSISNLIQLNDLNEGGEYDILFISQDEKQFIPDNPFIYYRDNKKGLAYQSNFGRKPSEYKFASFFESTIDTEFTYFGAVHPILFNVNGLYGYVGIHEKPFAKSLGKFVGGYARYELPSGQVGWVSKHGDIIPD